MCIRDSPITSLKRDVSPGGGKEVQERRREGGAGEGERSSRCERGGKEVQEREGSRC